MQRTDDDTWDLATSVGATATMNAAGRARATRADNPLIEDRFAEPLVRSVGIDFFTRWAAGELDPADVDIPDAAWGMQRMTDLVAVRTRFIDAFFADAAAAGIRQAVILASGLDARGYRLSWPPGTTLFEIDQPQVVEFKTATLAALGVEPTVELRSVPVDLRHDWRAALEQAGFDPQRPTAWLAEGIFEYLRPQAQDSLLDNITAASADGSQLVAVINMTAPGSGTVLKPSIQKLYENGLDVKLENLSYFGERNEVAPYLDSCGWHSVGTPAVQLFADNGLPVPAKDNHYLYISTLRKTTN